MIKIFTSRPYILYIPIGFLLYMGSLNGPFVFDDDVYIGNNTWIRSLRNFVDIFGMRYIGDLSFALNYSFSGPDPFWYHFTNVAIHILNSILVFHLTACLFETPAIRDARDNGTFHPIHAATVVSALFLVHPVQTQAVSYISQRYTSLAAFFYLSSILSYLKYRTMEERGDRGTPSLAFYFLALISCLFAMKVKEISFTLPFMAAFLEFGAFGSGDLRRRIVRLLPFFATTALIPLSLFSEGGNPVDEMFKSSKLRDDTAISRYDYLLTQTTVIIEYIRLLFYPANQHFDYNYPLYKTLKNPKVIFSSIAILASIITAVVMFVRARRNGESFGFLFATGLIWFFAVLSVESSVIPIKDVINEHRVYLPGVGFILSFTMVLFHLNGKIRNMKGFGFRTATLAVIILAVAAPVLSYATVSRNVLWGDYEDLCRDELSKNSIEPSPRIYLGIAYYKKGEFEKAAQEHKKALKLKLNEGFARTIHANLANIYIKQGLYDQAIGELLEVVRIRPTDTESHYALAVLYSQKGLFNEAERHLVEHLRVRPDDRAAEKSLGYIRAGRGSELKILIK